MRVEDHPALLAAAQRGGPVVPFFVWDPSDGFGADLGHFKQWWLRESLIRLNHDLRRLGVKLYTRKGRSTHELRTFLTDTGADAVFWNRCYEPDLLTRDEKLRVELAQEGLTAESFKAELLVEPWELSDSDVSPCFQTFHAYMRAWMTLPPPPQPLPCPSRLQPITAEVRSTAIQELSFDIPSGVEETLAKVWTPGSHQAKLQLDRFLRKVFPAFGDGRCRRHFDGTSKLSPHIRFGELSPRRMYHSTRLRVWRWRDQANLQNLRVSQAKKMRQSKAEVGTYAGKSSSTSRVLNEDGVTAMREGEEEGKLVAGHAGQPQTRANEGTVDHGENNDSSDASRSEPRTSKPEDVPSTPSPKVKANLPHISLSARAFLKNLCLRDFSYHVLFHNPDFNSKPLVPEFSHFPWAEDNGSFDSWRSGKTGYPIVDAAMRELKKTGWIHNGMRFLLACFLTKYLLLPWTRGLKEFYGLLLDGDHSANALGWQWTSGSNTDAFPVSCLVSPAKVALRHDPTGSYVRQWVPELAKLPTEYLHQPWKAPSELLKQTGIELGVNYPERIVLLSQARNRALDAMRVMKQIFMGSSVLRDIFRHNDKDLIKEWPDEEPEVLHIDDAAPFSGKNVLVPSLWALLQCGQPPTHLSGTPSGGDPLIAMDTASLTEGALAVPLDDQHESIEHALITAHDPGNSASTFAGAADTVETRERTIDDTAYGEDKNHDSHEALETGIDGAAVDAGNLEGPMNSGGQSAPFSESKAIDPPPTLHPPASRVQSEPLQNIQMPTLGASNPAAPQINTGSSLVASTQMMSKGINQASYHQHTQQQMQNFQQVHLQQFHPIHQLHQLHQQQQQRQEQQQQQQQQHQQHHRQHRLQIPQHAAQHPARPQQTSIQSPVHPIIDGVHGAAPSNVALPMTSASGLPMPSPPVLMGPAGPTANTVDLAGNPVFAGNDPSNAMYGPQFGMGHFYGYPPIMPMMNAHALTGAERTDVTGPLGSGSGNRVPLSGVLPVGYGIYNGNVFDGPILGNSFSGSGAPYRSLSVSSQPQQTHGGPQAPFGFAPSPVYITPHHADVLHGQGTANVVAPNSSPGIGNSRPGGQGLANSTTVAAAAAAVAAGEREVSINTLTGNQDSTDQAADIAPVHVANNGSTAGVEPFTANGRSGSQSSQQNHTVAQAPNAGKRWRGSTSSQRSADAPSRKNGKSASRPRTISKSRRTSSNATGGRGRNDGRGSTSLRRGGEGAGSSSQQRNAFDTKAVAETSLKKRQEILSSVLKEKDHEYHNFANFLALTCELTGNTDRQTSKDYIRLCNLKDDFHKQCSSNEEKLKIYRIKNFFSQVLRLEVTGEWDRHNHGGVRGPYVYGIRMRRPQASSH